MRITFYGAVQEVTGSMHLIEVNDQRLLLDCGLYQGPRAQTYQRNQNFAFNPAEIDALILSHAHIDHSGNIPNLAKNGFTGNIWCTPATRNLCTYMLMDSGHIQEQDAAYLNKKRARKQEAAVEPLYTRADAQAALGQFVSFGGGRPVTVADGVELTYFNAGHILGSALVQLDIREHSTGKRWRLVYSGDLGREEIPILCSPDRLDSADILILESTYGDRVHGTYADARRQLRNAVRETARKAGKVIIPAFAVGRTQEIVFSLNELDAAGDIPPVPVYVDSPLAVNATDVFRLHPEEWDDEVQRLLMNGRNPFDSAHIEYVRNVERSKQLNFINGPAVIISASGMAENGRILHHLKHSIGQPENTVLFVSFQAENTLGRRIADGASKVSIFGDEFEVRARVEKIDGYSAHADQRELLEWAGNFDQARLQCTFVVHGEPAASATLAEALRDKGMTGVVVPERCQGFDF